MSSSSSKPSPTGTGHRPRTASAASNNGSSSRASTPVQSPITVEEFVAASYQPAMGKITQLEDALLPITGGNLTLEDAFYRKPVPKRVAGLAHITLDLLTVVKLHDALPVQYTIFLPNELAPQSQGRNSFLRYGVHSLPAYRPERPVVDSIRALIAGAVEIRFGTKRRYFRGSYFVVELDQAMVEPEQRCSVASFARSLSEDYPEPFKLLGIALRLRVFPDEASLLGAKGQTFNVYRLRRTNHSR